MTMKIAVIDLDSVCYSIGHPNKVLDTSGRPVKEENKFVYYDKTEEELKQSADYMMNTILRTSEATHYIGYLKGEGTTRERKMINVDYKSNRSLEAPKWWKFVQNDLFARWKAIYVNDMEVDDAVNITVNTLPDSFICAIDKDLLSQPGTHYNWRKNEWVTVSKEEATKLFWTDMITGQTGDNVKGIPGKGPKAAEKILSSSKPYPDTVFAEYIDKFGEFEGIHEFYRTYVALKILDTKEGFSIPTPMIFSTQMQLFS